MLFEHLTSEDKNKIVNYIKEQVNGCGEMGELSHILRFWDKSKTNLWELFNHEFIKEIPIEFNEGVDDIVCKLREKIYDNKEFTQFEHSIVALFEDNGYKIRESVSDIFSAGTLSNNKYTNYWGEDNFEIPLADGKTLKLKNGTKPMKILSKIVSAYGLDQELFEKYRIAHSMCLNTKVLKGTLCLSIHPLDFMTMSDNDYGWSSCMSWSHAGEYRQGTVEMMNSPYVICAYLKGDNEYNFGSDTWNNKKWRCLFLVTSDFIVSVKSYPYYNDSLTKTVLKELVKLKSWEVKEDPIEIEDGEEIALNFNGDYRFYLIPETCGAMYNDFGSTTHWLVINPNINKDLSIEWFDYCGMSQCVWCGNTVDVEEGDETFLTCTHCSSHRVCCCCGRRVPDGDAHYIYDDLYCWSCFEDVGYHDEITHETIHEDDMVKIFLSTSNSTKKFIPNGSWYNRNFYTSDDVWEEYPEEWSKFFKNQPHWDKFNEKFFLTASDCTEKGLELFDIYSEADLKNYLVPRETVDFF